MEDLLIEFRNIGKAFYGVPVLKGINFKLHRGTVLGLVGENGAGKSTLMNILGGVVPADNGELLLEGKRYAPKSSKDAIQAGIAFIHQELNLFQNLTIYENFFISGFPHKKGLPFLNKELMKVKAKEILDTLGLTLPADTLVENLSIGERQLVEIGRALVTEAKVIIFDEPTTSLTSKETEKLFSIIKLLNSKKISIIYISHILEDIFNLCHEVMVLRDGEVVGHKPINEYTMDHMVSLMVGRNLENFYPDREGVLQSDEVLRVNNLSRRGVLSNISFNLLRGEILGVSGLMGAGRSELARAIFGLDQIDSGAVLLNGEPLTGGPKESINKGLAFLTESRREDGLLIDKALSENISLVKLPSYTGSYISLIDDSRLTHEVKDISTKVKIKSNNLFSQPVKFLSGGNQQKAVLAKWLLTKPKVFILDEPTRGIDVGAKYDIYNLINELADNGTGIILISSELEELIGLCDRILVMANGQIKAEYNKSEFDREEILKAALWEGKL
jgi:ribose transport system ATP-binding protein